MSSQNKEKVSRTVTLESKPYAKLTQTEQSELAALPSNSIVNKHLLSFVVAYKVHCYMLLSEHERKMTRPKLDLTMSQMSVIFNNPDLMSTLAACWPAATEHTYLTQTKVKDKVEGREIVSTHRIDTMKRFITGIYSILHEPWMFFDFVYVTRTTPLYEGINVIRSGQIKLLLMDK